MPCQVLDVASAAQRAVAQSTDADRRCVELVELARRAGDHAAALRRIAANLTDTAASVARLALDVCRYDSLQQAFDAATTYHRPAAPPIDVDTFLSLVDNLSLIHI